MDSVRDGTTTIVPPDHGCCGGSVAKLGAGPGAGSLDGADGDAVLGVVAGPARLLGGAVLGVVAPAVVTGLVGEGDHGDPFTVLGDEHLVLDVAGHGAGQLAHALGVLVIRRRSVLPEPGAEYGDDLTGLGF